MKRDMDLVRLLLLRTETGGDGGKYGLESEKYDVLTRAHHVAIMKEAGLVDAIVQNDAHGFPSKAFIKRLTWEGHEFLDAARNDTNWRKAKEKFLKPAGAWTFSVLLEFLKAEARKLALGPTGQ